MFSSKICHEYGLGKKFALCMNCVVVLPEFRNCPEVKHPGGGEDVVDAVNHIFTNAHLYGIDRNRIALAG